MGISLQQVSYIYQADTPFEGQALFDVDLEIKDGSYTALIGHTGSGKSTILQLLNGLIRPTKGQVAIDDFIIRSDSKNKAIKHIRQQVGLVFQFAENQVFDETVLKDVSFGPQNFGVPKEEAEQIARKKLAIVGISEELHDRSPFELSGGQMRRVAIAGILAMEPKVLVLDEPTAGLDPAGRKELMTLFKQLHLGGMTIVLVTHHMDDVADFADFVYVLKQGHVVKSGQPSNVFQEVDFMTEVQLGVPKITAFAKGLSDKGMHFDRLPITIQEFEEALSNG